MMRSFHSNHFQKIILAMNLVRCYNTKRKNYDLRKGDRNYHEKNDLYWISDVVFTGCGWMRYE